MGGFKKMEPVSSQWHTGTGQDVKEKRNEIQEILFKRKNKQTNKNFVNHGLSNLGRDFPESL